MKKMHRGLMGLVFVLHAVLFQSAFCQVNPETTPAARQMEKGETFFALRNRDSYKKALAAFQKAGSLYTQANDLSGVVKAAIRRGDTYYELRGFETAIPELEAVVEMTQGQEGQTAAMGMLLLRVGRQYMSAYDYGRALDYFEQAAPLLHQHLPAGHVEIARLNQRLGEVYDSAGNREKSLYHYRKSVELYLQQADAYVLELAELYEGMSSLHLENRQFDQALLYGKQSVTLLESKFGQKTPEIVDAYQALGHVYTVMEDNVPSLKYHQKALEIVMENFGDKDLMVMRGLNSMGNVYINLEDSARAVDYYRKSEEVALNSIPRYQTFVSVVYHNLGILYSGCNDHPEARRFWLKTLPYYKDSKISKNFMRTEMITWIGEAYQAEGLLDEALQYYQRAIGRLDPSYDTTRIYAHPRIDGPQDRDLMFSALGDKSALLLDRYRRHGKNMQDLTYAAQSFDACLGILDSLRKGTIGDNSRMDWNTFGFRFYEGAIGAAYEMYAATKDPAWQKKAFEYMERSKGSVLMGALNSSRAAHYSSVPDSLMEQEATMRKRIGELEMEIFELQQGDGEIDEERLKVLKAESFQHTLAFHQLVERIETEYPDYYALKYDLEVSDLDEIQEFLANEGASMIEYFVGDSALYACIITPTATGIYRLSVDSLEAKVKRYMRNFELDAIFKRTSREVYPEDGFMMYQTLLAPLQELPEDGKLIIVPDGELGQIPFEALLHRLPRAEEAGDFSQFPYLLRRYTISYANSATLRLNQPFRRHSVRQIKMMAMAPEFGVADTDGPYSEIRAGLSELRYAPIEVEKISRFVDTDVFTGAEATEALFKEESGNYNILHFATHGMVEDKNSLYSKIAFSAPQDSAEDGMLHTYELFSMKLNADLAVLSACNTGIGDVMRGEGIMSLARGFMYAGCPSIVMSLWSVNDEASSAIMEGFYRNLADGIDKDEALRQAKIAYLDKTGRRDAHPYFWAAHVLIGDTESFTRRGPGAGWLLLAFGLVIGAGVLVWMRRRAAAKN